MYTIIPTVTMYRGTLTISYGVDPIDFNPRQLPSMDFSGNICRVCHAELCRKSQGFLNISLKGHFQKHCFGIGSMHSRIRMYSSTFQNDSDIFRPHWAHRITRQALPRRALLRDCSLIRPEGAFCQKKSLSASPVSPGSIE